MNPETYFYGESHDITVHSLFTFVIIYTGGRGGGEWVWDLENLIYTIMRRNNLQFARNMFAKYNLIKRKF